MHLRLSRLIDQFVILAGKLEDLISSMNLSPNMLAFITTLPDNQKGKAINLIKKEPNISIEQIQQLMNQIEPATFYYNYEKDEAKEYKNIEKWILIQFRKLRKGQELPIELLRIFKISSTYSVLNEYERLSDNQAYPLFLNYAKFYSKLDQIYDWFEHEHPEIASYTAQQAIQASDQWHAEQAAQGQSKTYQEGSKNIVYGPNWKNPDFNGWTIRKIKTPNDLDVEGYLMNHCVGSYAEEVVDGQTDIYSLRDPSNKPHVTIEATAYTFKQIMGNSNSDPKDEYKTMLKEWFSTLGNANIDPIHNFDLDRFTDDFTDEVFEGDYGLPINLNDINFQDIAQTVYDKYNNNRYYTNDNQIKSEAEIIAQKAVDTDESLLRQGKELYDPNVPWKEINGSSVRELIKFINYNDRYESDWENFIHDTSTYHEFVRENPEPNEDDFVTDQEWQQAQEKWQEKWEEYQVEVFDRWYWESPQNKFVNYLRQVLREAVSHTELLKNHRIAQMIE